MLKQFGALYIILGTCIAAGLLGLPIVTATNHYSLTVMMVLSAWAIMTLGAWCLLQVNLWFAPQSNLITMSEATLGGVAKWLTWGIYLLLLYSLICAYLAASGDVVQALVRGATHCLLPRWLATIIAACGIGYVVFRGIRSVDLVNRFLMSIKLAICCLLILFVAPHVKLSQLQQGEWLWSGAQWLVIVCAFGYAIILPSIRVYLDSDRKALTRVIMIGSCLPLLIYLAWIAVIQGALPHTGPDGLLAMNHSAHTNSLLMSRLVLLTHQPVLKTISVVFVSICALTGLLGVSLSLLDFLADGLQWEKTHINRIKLMLLTMGPSLVVILYQPKLFITALAWAGFFCLYILVGLPIMMYLVGRRTYKDSASAG